MSKPNPMQPIVFDAVGVARFRANALVQFLLDAGPFDMNILARVAASREDRAQFAQLIGYSVSGFGDLSYVTDDEIAAASAVVDAAAQAASD